MSATTSLGKYQILGELGKGGFATVYRARDPDLGREVALKVLDPLLTRDPVWVARFRREARAVASLDHPRVVTVHEIGQAEGSLYIAMKLVEGGSLAQRIAAQGALPWDEVVRLTEQIAEALDFAHGQGVLHRDLKPANVLLDPRLGAVLSDFGFASLLADNSLSISMSGGVVGTPAYIAPEVWEDKEPSRQTDVYALGCIVYEMVAGQVLFAGSSTPAVMRAHFQPRRLPETWPEGTPQGLTDVLLTALAQEAAGRYAAAGELAAALTELREDTLAAPYTDLQDAVEGGRWQEALAMAGQVRAVDASYRDVVALEGAALAGLERAARVKQAAEWQSEAERALADRDFKGTAVALQKWQELMPDDVESMVFRSRLEQEVYAQGDETSVESVLQLGDQHLLPIASLKPGAPPEDNVLETKPVSTRRGRVWLGLALAAITILVTVMLWFGVAPQNDARNTETSQPVAKVTATSTSSSTTATVDATIIATWTVQVTDTPAIVTATLSPTWTPGVPTRTPTASPTATPRLTMTPTASPTSTTTTEAGSDVAIETAPNSPIAVRTANLRAGPGTNYAIAGSVDAQQALDIVGRNQVGDWLLIRTPSGEAWIAAFLVQNFDLAGLAVRTSQALSATPISQTAAATPKAEDGTSGIDVSVCGTAIPAPRDVKFDDKVISISGLTVMGQTRYFTRSVKELTWRWDGLDRMHNSDWYFDLQYTLGHQQGNPLLRTIVVSPGQATNTGNVWSIKAPGTNDFGGPIQPDFFKETCPIAEPNCPLHVRVQIALRNSTGAFACFSSAPSEPIPVPK